MKTYHYTKTVHLNSIFADGFIATEMQRTLSPNTPFVTDVAWFTEKKMIPITSLPRISSIPATSLDMQMRIKNLHTDFVEIGKYVGGFWRFGFDSEKANLKKWIYSKTRANLISLEHLQNIEKIANKVGDDVRTFWISDSEVPLENFSLEYLNPLTREWDLVIENLSYSSLTQNEFAQIKYLSNLSIEVCKALNLHQLVPQQKAA
jgi:hypothetical protein